MIVALQQLCDILHKTGKWFPNLNKGNIMFDFYKDLDKKFQEFNKQIKQVNDFWIESIISSLKLLSK